MHNYPKYLKIGLWITSTITALLLVLNAFSMPLALLFSGMHPNAEYILTPKGSLDENGRQLTVMCTKTHNGDHALTELHKNELGFWEIWQSKVLSADSKHLTMRWHTEGNSQSFHDPMTVAPEHNFALIGINAISRIDLSPDQLPTGCSFRIHQKDNFYIIHVRSTSDDPNTSAELSVLYDLLRHSGSVPK